MPLHIDVQSSTGPTTCPLCRSDLGVERARQVCSGCGTAYHRACLVDLGGCGTLGCWRRGAPLPQVRPRGPNPNNTLGNCLLPLGIGLATVTLLAGLTLLGGRLHPPRRLSPPAAPRPAPARTAARTPSLPVHEPATRPRNAPPPSILTVDRAQDRQQRLVAVTRAVDAVRSDLQLLAVCDGVAGGRQEEWARGALEERLRRLTTDPVAEARLRVSEALAAGATDAELEAAVRATLLSAEHDDRVLPLIAGDEPSPLARAALEPRLRAALEALDREAARAAAASAYAEALELAIARDRTLTIVERLLPHQELATDPARWRDLLDGPDPHAVAREARRRFVALGGHEAPDRENTGYERPNELAVGVRVRETRGVLAADDDDPTPTQRVLAALEAAAR